MQNGAQEADSPVKRVAKRSRQILDSDEEEDESPAAKDQVAPRGQGDEEALDTKEKVKDVPSRPRFAPFERKLFALLRQQTKQI